MSRDLERELCEPTQFVYPRGYFQVQVMFAEKSLQLGLSPDIQSALLNYTVVYRHLVGRNPSTRGSDQRWLEFVGRLSREEDVTDQVWQFYVRQPHSLYKVEPRVVDGQHFGSFVQNPAIDKLTGDQKIELHFNNQRRGQQKSDFSRQFTEDRVQDLTKLFQVVKGRMDFDEKYIPKWVTLISWMNNFPGVRATLPPIFVDSGTAVQPSELNFRSNSLWGQFLSNSGGLNLERYQYFREKMCQGNNVDQLVDCFPVKVYSFRSPIGIFLDYYRIK